MKLMLRITLVITVGLCAVLLLGTFTTWFSCPALVIYILKVIGGISFILAISLLAWGTTEFLFMSNEKKQKGALNNPGTELVSGGTYATLLAILVGVVILVTGNLSTTFQKEVLGFQKESLDLLKMILKYVKGP